MTRSRVTQATVPTLPNRVDTDVDGLNDREELNLGSDGFSTDPWKTDTDGDLWSDGYETLTKGTNPLAWDTDGDGARDSSDLDPIRNLLVAVRVNTVHHGADPWFSPELLGIIRVNDDYTWVTQHKLATLDQLDQACGWPDPQYTTASFDYTYYADVPDDVSSVSLRATAWSINCCRGDDILVDQFLTYTLNSGTSYQTLWNGNSWYSFDVWTHALPKAKTLFVTDGNATVTLSNGQNRLVGQDRYYVFTFDVTSAYGPFVVGVNAIVVPRSIFLDSKPRADFDAGTFAPLTDAPLYGEDLSQPSVSESVAGVVALTLSGAGAYDVLSRLLRNSTNVLVYAYVDVTSYVVLMNLPSDVVKILPWSSVTMGPTGAMPADFWQKIGAAASTVVNTLVQFGQMIYKGLVALGTFLVNLAEAIWDWGMKALGALWNTIVGVAQAAGEVLGQFVDWIVEQVTNLVNSFLKGIVAPLVDSLQDLFDATTLMALTVQAPGKGSVPSPEFSTAFQGFVLALAEVLLSIGSLQLLLLAVDIGLTALSITGFGSVVMIAAEVAVPVAFALVSSYLVKAIDAIFLEVLTPALAFSALILAIIGAFVAVISALTPQWTETTYSVVRNDFRAVYGELVDQVNIKPVITRETRRVYSQTAGSGTAILYSIVALMFVSLQLGVMASAMNPLAKAIVILIFDTIAVVLSVRAVVDAAGLPSITSLSRWSKRLAPVSLGVSSAAFAVDLVNYQRLESQGN